MSYASSSGWCFLPRRFLSPPGTRKEKPGRSRSLGPNTPCSSIFNPELVLIKSKSHALPSVFTCELARLTSSLIPIRNAASAPAPTAFTTQAARNPEMCVRSSERSCCALVLLIGCEWESVTGLSMFVFFLSFFIFPFSDVHRKEWGEGRREGCKRREDAGKTNGTAERGDSSTVVKSIKRISYQGKTKQKWRASSLYDGSGKRPMYWISITGWKVNNWCSLIPPPPLHLPHQAPIICCFYKHL